MSGDEADLMVVLYCKKDDSYSLLPESNLIRVTGQPLDVGDTVKFSYPGFKERFDGVVKMIGADKKALEAFMTEENRKTRPPREPSFHAEMPRRAALHHKAVRPRSANKAASEKGTSSETSQSKTSSKVATQGAITRKGRGRGSPQQPPPKKPKVNASKSLKDGTTPALLKPDTDSGTTTDDEEPGMMDNEEKGAGSSGLQPPPKKPKVNASKSQKDEITHPAPKPADSGTTTDEESETMDYDAGEAAATEISESESDVGTSRKKSRNSGNKNRELDSDSASSLTDADLELWKKLSENKKKNDLKELSMLGKLKNTVHSSQPEFSNYLSVEDDPLVSIRALERSGGKRNNGQLPHAEPEKDKKAEQKNQNDNDLKSRNKKTPENKQGGKEKHADDPKGIDKNKDAEKRNCMPGMKDNKEDEEEGKRVISVQDMGQQKERGGSVSAGEDGSNDDDKDDAKPRSKYQKKKRKRGDDAPVKEYTFEGASFFRYNKDTKDPKVEQILETGLYVSASSMREIRKRWSTPSAVARSLARALFADEALTICSVSGRVTCRGGNYEKRTALDPDGVTAVIDFVNHRALKKNWTKEKESTLKQAINNMLFEERERKT